MERLTAIAGLTSSLLSLSNPGDTIQLRAQGANIIMLNEVEGIDADAVIEAFQLHAGNLIISEVIPSAWLINDEEPIGELLYYYPDLKLTLSYNVDLQTIALNSENSIRVNIESETDRLKAGRFEDYYIELLFNDKAKDVKNILDAHGLKIKKLDTEPKHITVIELEPRT